jgi:hypothetical protein
MFRIEAVEIAFCPLQPEPNVAEPVNHA